MKYKNADYRAREAHARSWVQNLGRRVGWTFTTRLELLPPLLRQGFYDPEAHLVVMGAAEDLPWGLKTAVEEVRCTALVAQPGFAIVGCFTCYFTLLRCAGGQLHWHSGLQLWMRGDKRLFLVPDPDGDDADGQCFAIESRQIQPCAVPWSTIFDRGHGLGQGQAILMMP